MASSPDLPLDDWVKGYAAGLAPGRPLPERVRWVEAPSGARLAFVEGPGGGVVAKLHHPRTDAADLSRRLATLADPVVAHLFVPPLVADVTTAPDGRLVTWWPQVEVLGPGSDEIPWGRAGELLALLHSVAPSVRDSPRLPEHGAVARLRRAAHRARQLDRPARDLLAPLADRLVSEVARTASAREAEATRERKPARRHTSRVGLCHGDFHLGQLGRQGTRWRLLDVDDLGVGDPAWDLARPAGFWAAGLLDDAGWHDFLAGYGVTGDPWPWLDLPARCAVLVAAVRAVDVQQAHREPSGEALLDACRRM